MGTCGTPLLPSPLRYCPFLLSQSSWVCFSSLLFSLAGHPASLLGLRLDTLCLHSVPDMGQQGVAHWPFVYPFLGNSHTYSLCCCWVSVLRWQNWGAVTDQVTNRSLSSSPLACPGKSWHPWSDVLSAQKGCKCLRPHSAHLWLHPG